MLYIVKQTVDEPNLETRVLSLSAQPLPLQVAASLQDSRNLSEGHRNYLHLCMAPN